MRPARLGRRPVHALGDLMVVAGLMATLVGGSPAVASTSAQSAPEWATASDIDAFVQQERTDLKLSGLAVVVLAGGSVLFDRAYGDAAPGGPAVTLQTPFVLGSTSKQFTGLAVQQLVAQGTLSLNDTVGTRLRRFGGDRSPFATVTVAQLLSHTSGISTAAGTADVFDPLPSFTSLDAEVRHLLGTVPSSRPGTRFEYSNGNYSLLGAIVETATGRSFEDSLQTLVARPLGLGGTTSDLASAQTHGLAVGHYTWLGAIDTTTPGPRWPMGAPSAYTSSTAADLTRLMRAELGQSSGIAPAVFTADHAPLATVDTFSRYASGWYLRKFWELHGADANYTDPALPLLYEHDGDIARETSYLAFSPDLGFAVVVLSNTGLGTDTGRFGEFTYRLLHTIVGTKAAMHTVDPLVSAAPLLMVAMPVLQLAAVVLATRSLVRRRRRLARVLPLLVSLLVTMLTSLAVFVVVPGQTQQPLLDRVWWGGVPDLAASVAVSLVFVVAWVIVAAVGLVRGVRPRTERSPVAGV